MRAIVTMALKDLQLLTRDRLGAFFIFGFPVLMGIFFGLVIGGLADNNRGTMRVTLVDEDNSIASQRFAERLGAINTIELVAAEREMAAESVRKGQSVAVVILPAGFGERAGVLWGEPASIQLGIDPSRAAESAMLQGYVLQTMGTLVADWMNIPARLEAWLADTRAWVGQQKDASPEDRQAALKLLDRLSHWISALTATLGFDATDNNTVGNGEVRGLQLANIESIDVTRNGDPDSPRRQLLKLRSRWDISFPQAMMWGVLGCVAGFSISIARERTLGTLVRLRVAPVSTFSVLAGKGLACFLAAIGVVIMMTLLGVLLGMRPASYANLAVAAVCIAFCFVGIMMALSVLGRTEQSAAGIGWAANLVMAMFGGCMIPVMFMPRFMQGPSNLSPIRWSILALEGAIWRQFSWSEMLLPCTILLAVGVVGIAIGTSILSRQTRVAN